MHAQIESRSPFLSYRLMPYFQKYRNELTYEHNTKPYITRCLSNADPEYPVLQKKIGFTFGNNDAFIDYAVRLLTKRQISLIKAVSHILPAKLTNRLIMLEMFYSAHLKFRSKHT